MGKSKKIENDFVKESFTCSKRFSPSISINAYKVLNNCKETLKIFTSLEKKLSEKGRTVGSKELTQYLQKYNNKDSLPAKHLIMFSGGYDSLSLTLRYLEKGEIESKKIIPADGEKIKTFESIEVVER